MLILFFAFLNFAIHFECSAKIYILVDTALSRMRWKKCFIGVFYSYLEVAPTSKSKLSTKGTTRKNLVLLSALSPFHLNIALSCLTI